MAATTSTTSSDNKPKRVVLRLKVSDFDGPGASQFGDAIKAYLLSPKRPTTEYEANRHFAHTEPFQSPEVHQTSFHIVLDIEKDMLENGEFQSLLHEIYRIRRNEQGTLEVKPSQNPPEGANLFPKYDTLSMIGTLGEVNRADMGYGRCYGHSDQRTDLCSFSAWQTS